MSRKVDEKSINAILSDYETIIVGSDQVWSPSQRSRACNSSVWRIFPRNKISYAVDSTVSEIDPKHVEAEEGARLNAISVRNKHSQEFVELTGKVVPMVAVRRFYVISAS